MQNITRTKKPLELKWEDKQTTKHALTNKAPEPFKDRQIDRHDSNDPQKKM